MEAFICMLCPVALALLVYEKVSKKKLETKSALCAFALFTLATNCITIMISRFAFRIKSSMSAALVNSPTLVTKYAVIAVIVALLLAVIFGVLQSVIKLNVTVKKDDNEKSKKNSRNK